MNFKPFNGSVKAVAISSYYSEENAIKVLPIVQALLAGSAPLVVSYDGRGRTGVYQLINGGWHYLEDNGPQIESLKGQNLNWSQLCNTRKDYKLTMSEDGLVISARVERKISVKKPAECKVSKVNWEYELMAFLEKEDATYPFVIKDIQLSTKDEEKAHKLLQGLGNLEYQITSEMILLKGAK